MSNQSEAPGPTNKPSNNNGLIAACVLVAMSCICMTIIACGAGALVLWVDSVPQSNIQYPGEAVPSAPPITSREKLDVTRAEMIDFFSKDGAFAFASPVEEDRVQLVIGTHTSLCLEEECAVVTLIGPEENLLRITVAVPTDSNSTAQTSRAIALLMKTAKRFPDGQHLGAIPSQIMTDILKAQASREELKISLTNNGYVFLEMYDPETQQATLSIMPANNLHRPIGNLLHGLLSMVGAVLYPGL